MELRREFSLDRRMLGFKEGNLGFGVGKNVIYQYLYVELQLLSGNFVTH